VLGNIAVAVALRARDWGYITREWRKSHKNKFRNFHSAPIIVKFVKSRKKRDFQYMQQTKKKKRNSYILVGTYEWKTLFVLRKCSY
jgi:hypothetical protein